MQWRRLGVAVTGSFLLFLLVGLFGPPSAEATHTKYTSPIKFPVVLTDQHVHVPAFDRDIQVLAGAKTRLWTLGGTWPPPTIRRPTGRTSEVTFYNFLKDIQIALPDHSELTIHHHGAHVAPVNDGWACGFFIFPFGGITDSSSLVAGSQPPAVATGALATSGGTAESTASTALFDRPFWRTYRYAMRESDAANPTGNERGVTQWYHNHRVDVTTQTIRMGLGGGFFIVDDPADPQTLPRGVYDRTLMITDRSFDANNQIAPVNNGDHVLVNGVPQPFMNVDTHKYRFRVLNPSVARRFALELVLQGNEASTDPAVLLPVQQIGTDSGLLPAPVTRTSLPIGIAERYEFVIDFGKFPVGTNLILRNGLALGTAQGEIMQFRVTRKVPDISRVPPTLRPIPGVGTPVKTRTWNFTRDAATGAFTINDLIMDCNRFDANMKLNTREEWVLRNAGGWVHSIHIHDVDQLCVSRNGGPCGPEEPFKEVWPMLANETIVVQLIPTDFTQSPDLSDGAYMLHCHVLNHEDLAMMTQWIVTKDGD
jgi:spore coat protein A, manganese oxidase